jgi:hypothetical protein
MRNTLTRNPQQVVCEDCALEHNQGLYTLYCQNKHKIRVDIGDFYEYEGHEILKCPFCGNDMMERGEAERDVLDAPRRQGDEPDG